MSIQRTRLVSEITAIVAPHLWRSGYVNGDGSPVKLFAFKEPEEVEGFTVSVVDGFTEDGIIDDAYAGGLGVTPFSSMPLEDLRLVCALARRMFPAEGASSPA